MKHVETIQAYFKLQKPNFFLANNDLSVNQRVASVSGRSLASSPPWTGAGPLAGDLAIFSPVAAGGPSKQHYCFSDTNS